MSVQSAQIASLLERVDDTYVQARAEEAVRDFLRRFDQLTLAQKVNAVTLFETIIPAVHHCEHCGAEFITGKNTGRTSRAKYCSNKHRVAALRAKAKEAGK